MFLNSDFFVRHTDEAKPHSVLIDVSLLNIKIIESSVTCRSFQPMVVKSRSGELKFLGGSEDSDTDINKRSVSVANHTTATLCAHV